MRDTSDTDFIIYILCAAYFGPALLANIIPGVRDALVSWHVLTTHAVLLPIAAGAGLDMPRLLIALGILGLVATLVGISARQHASSKQDGKR